MTADAPRLKYRPGLDGIRGIAMAAVLVYHGGYYPGGFLWLDVFFVLSGYLITSLLLAERRRTGSISLGKFWGRRARRLLPALFCLVTVVSIHQAIVGVAGAVPDFRMDALSALFYFANWHEIVAGTSYFAQTALTSPLEHTWSLAIEEQFYVAWPLLLLLLWRVLPSRRGPREAGGRSLPPAMLACILAGAAASALEMALLYDGGAGVNRVYYGTDTRAQALLIGAGLAVAVTLALDGRRGFGWLMRGRGRLAVLPCVAGAGGLIVLCALARSGSNWVYEGGFLAVDLTAAAVIWSVTTDGGRLLSLAGRALGWWPFRASGQISYGLYLWHFPLYLWLDEATTGLSGWQLFLLRVGSAYGAAVISYFVVEQPIRARRLPAPLVRVLAPSGLAVAVVSMMVAVASSTAVAAPVAALPPVPQQHTGTQATCKVALPGSDLTQTFHTCPPVRVLLVGDSVALTLGSQLAYREQAYGILLDNQAIIGCGYGTEGSVAFNGGWVPVYPPCKSEGQTWSRVAQQFRPQVVVVEMGWWDQDEHEWNGGDVQLGEPAYDAYVDNRMVTLARQLGSTGAAVVLLTVPLMDPPPLPDGATDPAASHASNEQINSMLAAAAAKAGGSVHVFDLAPELTPSGNFSFDVDGSVCRSSDGVHMYDGPTVDQFQPTVCGAKLQAALFPVILDLASAK